MNRQELIERLKGFEWNDVEFKEALNACPKSAYETVSAFANTSGGWLVFGVKEQDGEFEIIGVKKVNKVETEFLSTLHQPGKISCPIDVEPSFVEDNSAIALVFFIPEVRREDKPVYLNGNIKSSYIRRGSGDHKCTEDEIKTFLREASVKTYDTELIDIDYRSCFEEDSIRWYRNTWQRRNPNRLEAASDTEFLQHFGLLKDTGEKILPTRAALLLFGKESAIMQIFPRSIIDFRRLNSGYDEALPDQRWDDRDLMECNLIVAWRRILEFYQKIAEIPFKLDSETLERDDKPVDYTAFREATINVLTHQDFGDHTRNALIQIFKDRFIFWNPGASFISKDEMFQPGGRPIRNPQVASMFRRIGLGEQAGTGISAIYSNWRILKRVPPVIENNKSDRSFCLTLLKEELVSDEQILFQAKLGVNLSEEEAAAFAQVWRTGKIWLHEARAISGLSILNTKRLLARLTVQNLIEPKEGLKQTHYLLAEHLREIKTEAPKDDVFPKKKLTLPSDQVKPLKEISDIQRKIIDFSDSPHPITQIMTHVGLKNRTFFRKNHIDPLLENGILKMSYPDKPKHPKQAYVLTEIGFKLKSRLSKKDKGNKE